MIDCKFDAKTHKLIGEDAAEVGYQVSRLSGLPKFPREEAGARELALAIATAPSIHAAYDCVSRMLEDLTACPTPAEIRTAIAAAHPVKRRRCDACGGGGFMSVPVLVTYRGDSFEVQWAKRLDGMSVPDLAEFAESLRENRTNQIILSAAVPCQCLPLSHAAFAEARG